jgi:exopolysaccharide biosynthesis polyprenyl glycosylphosphotransferase
MKRSEALFGAIRIPLDALAVLAALLLSYRLREANIDLVPSIQLLDPASTLPPLPAFFRGFMLPSALSFVLFAAGMGLYALQATRSAWSEVGRVIAVSLLWLVGIMAWYFLVQKQLFYSRLLLLHGTLFIALFVAAVRGSLTMLQRWLLRRGIGVRAVVSVGHQAIPETARETLTRDPRYVYLGHLANLDAVQQSAQTLDLVIQTDPNPDSSDTLLLIDHCRSHHIGYAFLPPVFADVPHQLMVERLGMLPMIRFRPTPIDGWGRIGKRLFDVIGSLCLIVVFSLPIAVVSMVALLLQGWPIFYVSRRIGENGNREVAVLKFRTMVRDADARKADLAALNHRRDGPLFKVRNDPRVTSLGRILRRWDIDEWPQLFNVFIGAMSLIGPRPHLPEEVSRYTDYQRRVFAVKPGITGLSQVSGRSTLTFAEEVALDLTYVEEWSLPLDLWILWRTLVIVVMGRGAE